MEGSATGPATATSEEEAARLRIAAARSEREGAAGSGEPGEVPATVEELTGQLLAEQENAETARQEADELRDQVGSLEERVEDMERLLSLKDEQLARLQDSVSDADAEAVM